MVSRIGSDSKRPAQRKLGPGGSAYTHRDRVQVCASLSASRNKDNNRVGGRFSACSELESDRKSGAWNGGPRLVQVFL